MEVGGQSPCVSRLACDAGLEVNVANPRRVQLITRNERKNDRTDAELLARLGRVDPQLLSRVTHRSVECQADLAVKRARDVAVASRTALINHVRGAIKSFGQRLPACSPDGFHKRVVTHLPVELVPAPTPIVHLMGQVTEQIKSFDVRIEQLADERYPATKLLRQVSSVGPVTTLSFVLTLDTPSRVSDSRQVGPYLGLVPRTHDSGASAPQLRITKAGDPGRRRLLVIAANRILGPFGPDCDLRRFGLKLAAQGGRMAASEPMSPSRASWPCSCITCGRRVKCRTRSIWPRSVVRPCRPDLRSLSNNCSRTTRFTHPSHPVHRPSLVTARMSLCLEHAA
jgi:hypothetical protein